jgi:hypothetical protein
VIPAAWPVSTDAPVRLVLPAASRTIPIQEQAALPIGRMTTFFGFVAVWIRVVRGNLVKANVESQKRSARARNAGIRLVSCARFTAAQKLSLSPL